MAGRNSSSTRRRSGAVRARPHSPDFFRVLDWTRLDSLPSLADVNRLINLAGAGAVRLAIIVDTPRKLRTATIFADQASIEGAEARVFVDAQEALAWLYKDVPAGELTN